MDLSAYMTLIQLISAVNFAYISLKFNQKIFDTFFNINAFYNMYEGVGMNIIVKYASFVSMSKKSDEKLIKQIEEGKVRCMNLDNKWDELYKDSEAKIKSHLNVKGFNSLFLFVSLFCVYDLFLLGHIARISSVQNEVFLFLVNLFSLMFCGYYMIKIIRQKDDRHSTIIYNESVFYSLVSFFVPLVISSLITDKSYFVKFCCLFDEIHILNSVLCVLIPFVPCIFTYMYTFIFEKWLSGRLKQKMSDITKELESISELKNTIETSQEVLNVDFTFDKITPPNK